MRKDANKVLTTGQAATLCAVTPDAVLKWIKKGKLSASRTAGGHYRIAFPDLEPFLADFGQRKPGDDPVPTADSGCELNIDLPSDIPCWEFLADNGNLREACRRCIVYRVRASRCFLMAGLEPDVGHAHQFCEGTCEECLYYRRIRSRRARLLLITPDGEFASRAHRLDRTATVFRVARNGYEAAIMVPELRPDLVLIDLHDVPAGLDLLDSLAADPRLPDVRVILVVPSGEGRHPLLRRRHRLVVAVLEKDDVATRLPETLDRIIDLGSRGVHRTA